MDKNKERTACLICSRKSGAGRAIPCACRGGTGRLHHALYAHVKYKGKDEKHMDRVKEAFAALKVAENHFQNAEAEYVDAACLEWLAAQRQFDALIRSERGNERGSGRVSETA